MGKNVGFLSIIIVTIFLNYKLVLFTNSIILTFYMVSFEHSLF